MRPEAKEDNHASMLLRFAFTSWVGCGNSRCHVILQLRTFAWAVDARSTVLGQLYQIPTFEHVLSADQKAWELLVRRCASEIPQVRGKLLFDKHLDSAL